MRGGNQAGEVGRAPSEESWAHGRDIQQKPEWELPKTYFDG